MRSLRLGARLACVAVASTTLVTVAPVGTRAEVVPTVLSSSDWRGFGRDAHRTFSGPSTISAANAATLAQRWFFPTGDAVTASPTVVAGTVYVGSWDGNFYAIDAATGEKRWAYRIKDQPAVSPRPGDNVVERRGSSTSDGGLITSSAWFEPGDAATGRPDLVIFGGGFTLYALRASDGTLYWAQDYTGWPEDPPDPENDYTRIFSSPLVVGSRVIFGVSADGADGYRGYLAAADLATGGLLWRFETDVDEAGNIQDDGCSGIWSSPTYDEVNGTVVASTSDCDFNDAAPFAEKVIAVRVADGTLAWKFTPPRVDPGCDWDFGATANLGTLPDGKTRFLGVGGKDGTYYALDPATGVLRWQQNVVFGGYAGGFIGSSAFDGTRVYGATALGDFGQVAGFGVTTNCANGNLRDNSVQEPSVHAFNATTGVVEWQGVLAQSFAATTTANGLVYVASSIVKQVQIRDAATGRLVAAIPVHASLNSGITPVDNAIYFGMGGPEQGELVGVASYALAGPG